MRSDKDKGLSTEAAELRRQAEERLHAKRAEFQQPRTEEELQRLVHELEVHQIELEMQNEQLRQASVELEKARDKYADLYDFAPVGYFTLDHKGVVQAANLSGAGLLGIERSLLPGRRFGLFVTIEDRPAFADFLDKVFANEGKDSCEVTLLGKENHPLFAQIEALSFASGQECRVAVIDITVRKQTEAALRATEQKLRNIVEHSTNLFYIHSSDQIFTYVSPQSRQFFDCEPEEALVRWTEFITDNPVNQAAIEATQRAIDTRQRQPPYQVECIGRNGRKVWVEVNEAPVVENGKTVAVVGSLTDITERKRAEESRELLLVQLDAVLNSITEGVVISDLTGNILTMNPSALAFHEFESVEQVRRQLSQLANTFEVSGLDGQIVPLDQWPLSRVLRGERFADFELRVNSKDTGTTRVGSYSGAPVQTQSGEVILAVITVRDITEHKRAEAEIQRLASFPLLNPNPVLELDAEGQMTFCNPAAKQILEKVGYVNGINTLIPQDMAEILQALRNKKPGQFIRNVAIDGRFFEELVYATPQFQTVRIYTMDITKRKLAEEQIEILNTDLAARAVELEDANRELEAFNYSVAHDLRNPLNVISGYCQVIEELCSDKLDEQCRNYLQETHNGALRMNGLIDALLELSRLAHAELNRERVDLSRMAEEVAGELKGVEHARRVEIRIADGIVADGDAPLLRVVLANLIGNAWKYTGKSEEGIIEFGMTEADGRPAFFVRDNGPGFDMKDADKLFVPFQRLPGAEKCRGFGIGLATVERIIRRHGGRVWAEGEQGKGATFYFTLSADRS